MSITEHVLPFVFSNVDEHDELWSCVLKTPGVNITIFNLHDGTLYTNMRVT